METEGKAADTPERRASLQRAVEQRVAEITDPIVRDYYRTDMRSRLGRLRRPEGRPGDRASGGSSAVPGPSRHLSPPARPPGAPAPTSTARARNAPCWAP